MVITDDMYYALSRLKKWYNAYNSQFIQLIGTIGTGIKEVINEFLNTYEFDKTEVMYLSFDQKKVLDYGSRQLHCYYINRFLYKYTKEVDMNSLYVINKQKTDYKYKWIKKLRKNIDPNYKIIIVLEAYLLDREIIKDLSSFGIPIILVNDPILFNDNYTILCKNLYLRDLHPKQIQNPIIYFANKVVNDNKLSIGNYDNVSIINKNRMNIYNLKSSDMIITISKDLSKYINKSYREKILNTSSTLTLLNEKLIIKSPILNLNLTNQDEKKIKIYLDNGLIGYLSKCNKHALSTKYIGVDFRPEFYFDSFEDLYLDRYYLNDITAITKQEKPDDIIIADYAYSLHTDDVITHFDKVTVINDNDDFRRLYKSIISAKKSLTLII